MITDMRPCPVFWDFTTKPPSVIPVDITTATPSELRDIATYYPDLTVATNARRAARHRNQRDYDVDVMSDDWTYGP